MNIYITRLASNEIFSPSNKIHREVGRAKDLSASRYRVFTVTLRHSTLGKTPLDEWSARLTDVWQNTTLTRERCPCRRRDSNPQFQQASGHRSRLHRPIVRQNFRYLLITITGQNYYHAVKGKLVVGTHLWLFSFISCLLWQASTWTAPAALCESEVWSIALQKWPEWSSRTKGWGEYLTLCHRKRQEDERKLLNEELHNCALMPLIWWNVDSRTMNSSETVERAIKKFGWKT
jgi:hypothetical protein